jgi:hypothetical protein
MIGYAITVVDVVGDHNGVEFMLLGDFLYEFKHLYACSII